MAAGLPLPNLQARIGDSITAQAAGKHDQNESIPGSAVPVALVDAPGALVNHPAAGSGTVLESVGFREKRFTRKREEVRIEATVLRLVERSLAVEDALGLPSMAWPVPRDPAEAEHAAREPRASRGRYGAPPTTGAPLARSASDCAGAGFTPTVTESRATSPTPPAGTAGPANPSANPRSTRIGTRSRWRRRPVTMGIRR